MKKLFFSILSLVFMLFGTIGFAQSDCNTIQCDCENILEADKDPGLVALCKYYENLMVKRCKDGVKDQQCRENAKGPSAWEQKSEVKKKEEVATNPDESSVSTNQNIDQLLQEIRSSENGMIRYLEVYESLENIQNKNPGLELAMKICDLGLSVHVEGSGISVGLMMASHIEEYDEMMIHRILSTMIKSFSRIDKLDIDQIDMKYRLGFIFEDMKAHGFDVNNIFDASSRYHDEKVLLFIQDCYVSKNTKLKRKQMKELRETSSRVYLRKIDYRVPLANKPELTVPIWNISNSLLDWNENMLDQSLKGLEAIAQNVEKRSWNQNEMKKARNNFDEAYNSHFWVNDRYINYFKTISRELPIVYELMKAVF